MKFVEILSMIKDEPIGVRHIFESWHEEILEVRENLQWLLKMGLIEIHQLTEDLNDHITWITSKGLCLIKCLKVEDKNTLD